MPRTARKNSETCFFHVMVQGVNKEYVFNEEKYIKKYYRLLCNNLERYQVKIPAYCIMNNHAHMLIYTEKIDEMSKYMHSVNTAYSKYYNSQKERVGVVFRNRYESEPIQNRKHLYSCIAYIHNNPVKANMVDNPSQYKYSSYNNYINNSIDRDILRMIFGTSEKYIDVFKAIHMITEKDIFIDIAENTDWDKKIDRILQEDIGTIIMNSELLRKYVNMLVTENKVPIKLVCEKFKLSRYKILKLIEK